MTAFIAIDIKSFTHKYMVFLITTNIQIPDETVYKDYKKLSQDIFKPLEKEDINQYKALNQDYTNTLHSSSPKRGEVDRRAGVGESKPSLLE